MNIDFERREAELQDAIRACEKVHERWNRLESVYRNGTDLDYLTTVSGNRQITTVNIAYSNVRTIDSLTLPSKLKIVARARRQEDAERAPVVESLLDAMWNDQHVEDEEHRSLIDACIFGLGVIKVGFSAEFGNEKLPSKKPALLKRLTEAIGMVAGKPPDESVWRKGRDDQAVEYRTNIVSGRPWSLRISPFNFYPDPLSDRIEDGRYVVHRFTRVLEDAQRDPLYHGLEDVSPSGEMVPADSVAPGTPGMFAKYFRMNPYRFNVVDTPLNATRPPGTRLLNMYEFWDKRDQKMVVMVPGLKHYVREVDWPFPELGMFPFLPLVLNLSPDELFGIGEIEPIFQQQRELNSIRMFSLEHYRRCAQEKILTERGALTDEQKRNFVTPDISKIVECDNPAGVIPLQGMELKPEVYAAEDRLLRDIFQIAGLSENQRGAQESGVTATQSGIIQQNVGLLTERRRKIVRQHASKVLQAEFKMWRNLITTPQLVRIVGQDGANTIVAADPKDLHGEFDVDIEVQESVEQNQAIRRESMLQLFNLSAQAKATGLLPNVNLEELYKDLLETYDLPNRHKINPETPPELTMGTAMPGMGVPGMEGQPGQGGQPGGTFAQGGGLVPQNQLSAIQAPTAGTIQSKVAGNANLKRGPF